ncbi:sensor histidine kinase [Paenibacillus thailandensis]|uniref:sensor histidine kinase n=1 Tax=Paenibacillus thailandensis TaxID=393250 RepID=UPI0036348B42
MLLRNNAEKHIQQTAVQAAGKLDVLLRQVDTFTAQVATSATIQRLMAQEAEGEKTTFAERQSMLQEIRKHEAYTTGIRSLELYTTDYRMLFPLTDVSLNSRVPQEWINEADAGMGRLVWLGLDPRNPDVVIAIRNVRLIDHSFSYAGYLMVQVEKNYFEFSVEGESADNGSGEMMGLFDGAGKLVTSDFPEGADVEGMLHSGAKTIELNGSTYMPIQKRSEATGWRIIILTPVNYAAEGISVLRTVVVVSVIIGGGLFLVMTFILSTMITRPILNLIKVMRGAKLGTLKPISVPSSAMEINELNNTYNQMVDSLNELIEVVYQKEIVQSRTELKALQAQINPHFLFNTLEAFYWALEEKGEEELAEIVVAMSGLFRYVIAKTDGDEWVTVGDELDHAERYLKIMDMRMVDRLSWSIEADEECRGAPVPKLLVQPLVENAILHGVEQRLGRGTVLLRATPSDRPGYTRIEVTDNGPGMDDEKLLALRCSLEKGLNSRSEGGNGVGLANVQKRLMLYVPGGEGLTVHSSEGQGTTVSFEIPNAHKGEVES